MPVCWNLTQYFSNMGVMSLKDKFLVAGCGDGGYMYMRMRMFQVVVCAEPPEMFSWHSQNV